MATSAQVETFRGLTADLVLLAQRDMRDFWAALDVEGDPLLVKAAIEAFFPDLVTAYGDAAALLGADFYDELRDVPASSARFSAVIQRPADEEQALAVSRWGLGPLFESDPNPVQALLDLSGAVQRLVMKPARDTVYESARRDPVRTGFARVPRGAKTCRFCTMIASRGAVYGSAASAGESNRWHNDCDCAIVPVRSSGDFPDGYAPSDFLSLYAAGVGVGRVD